MTEKSYLLRHRFISSLVDLNLPGINRLAVFLSNKLIPKYRHPEGIILQTIHGIKLHINPAQDQGLEKTLYAFGTYEKGIIRYLEGSLTNGSVFLDIGANIGLMTCVASRLVGPNGKVLAFEANPKTVPILEQNLALNECENVVMYPFGLGNEQGTATFYENWDVNRGGASFLKQGEQSGTDVRIEKLDDLLEEQRIDLVKIDVEGFELFVLQGGQQLFEKTQPIFILEVSEQRSESKGVSPKEIMDFVQKLGNYRFYKLKGTKERASKLVEIKSARELPEHDNIICIPNKS